MLLTIAALSLLVQMALGQPIDPVMTLVSILPMIQSLDVVSLLRTARAIVSMGSAPLVATFSAYVTWPRSGCLVRSAARPPSPPTLTVYWLSVQVPAHPMDRPARSSAPARRIGTPDTILVEVRARAPAAGLAAIATAAPSGLGCMAPAAAAVVRRPPRIVLCVPLVPSQVVEARLPARHGQRTTLRQARGRQQRRWLRRRRRGACRRPLADRCTEYCGHVSYACVDRHV